VSVGASCRLIEEYASYLCRTQPFSKTPFTWINHKLYDLCHALSVRKAARREATKTGRFRLAHAQSASFCFKSIHNGRTGRAVHAVVLLARGRSASSEIVS
jgi:hypothetical protein